MDLEVTVDADVTKALSKLDALKSKIGQLTESQQGFKDSILKLNKALKDNEANVAGAAAKLKLLSSLSSTNKEAVAAATAELKKFAAINDDLKGKLSAARTGLFQTNLELKETSKQLRESGKASGSLSKVFSGLRSIANIIPGIGMAGLVALIAGPLVSAFENLFTASKKASDVIKDMSTDIHAGGKEYEKAAANVNELAINIDLAKKGFLDKKKVLKEYNETIGKTTGQVKTLDEAEAALVKNGPAYIQMMLLKAAANFALESAAKKAFEAEELRRKNEKEFLTNLDKFSVLATKLSSAPGTLPLNLIEQQQKQALKIEGDLARQRKNQAVKIADDASKQQLDIAKKFQLDAAAIAKTFPKGDFFGGTEDDPGKATKQAETIADVLKKAAHDIKVLGELGDILGLNKATEQVGVLKSALSHLLDAFPESGQRQGAVIKFTTEIDEIELREKLLKTVANIESKNLAEIPVDITLPKASQLASTVKNVIAPISKELEAFRESVASLMTNIAESVSASFAALVTGTGGLRQALESVLGLVGQFLIDFGKGIIKAGALAEAIKKIAAAPGAGIAVGIAAIVLGNILKSVSLPKGFATGGFVSGPGTAKSDSIPARLSNGEYVMSAATVSRFGKSFFDMINSGGRPRNGGFADGGPVGGIGGGQLITVEVVGRLRGKDIYFTNIRAGQTIGRNG